MIKRNLKSVAIRLLSNRIGSGLLRPLWRGRASIFMLHRLSQVVTSSDTLTIDSITETLRALRDAGAKFIALSKLFELAAAGKEPEPGSVAFTIDDGFADQGVIAREAFHRNQCPVTVFLITDFVDGRSWPWDDQIHFAIKHAVATQVRVPPADRFFTLTTAESRRAAGAEMQNYCKSVPWKVAAPALAQFYNELGCHPPSTPPVAHRALTWDEIQALESPYIEFAPHSLTHRITSRLEEREVHDEIAGSWDRCKQQLRRAVPVYAWPTGRASDFTDRDIRIAKSLGLVGAVATCNDYGEFRATDRDGGHLFRVRRFALSALSEDNLQLGTGIERLKQRLRGYS